MADDIDNNFELNGAEETPPPVKSGNRNFIIAVSVLGGLFVLALILMAVFVAVILPRNRANRAAEVAAINQANTATVAALTQAVIDAYTPPSPPATSTPEPTNTLPPTNTAVVVQATNTPEPQLGGAIDPRTATVSALLTQAADAKLTTTVLPTSTALPSTGFMDEMGVPGLLGMTVLLVVVIFLVRRLRATTA
jgi:LPXTG-motif cell wall-anchored protein